MQKVHIKVFSIIFLVFFYSKILGQSFSYIPQNEGVMIQENNQNVLFYQQKTKSLNGQYPRANYIHPLYGLNGEVLTEDFPADHLHHRGIFWAWHQIIVNGQKVADAWDCKNIVWNVKKINYSIDNKGLRLKSKIIWQTLKSDSTKSQKIVEENTQILIHPKQNNYRMIDFEIELKALVKDLKIGGSEDHKGYSGFSMRLVMPENLKFIAQNQAISPQETALDLGNYLTFEGNFAPEILSRITLFCHPTYPTQKQTWILRQKNSMQNAVFPGAKAIPIPSNQNLKLKYRLLIHQSEVDLQQMYKDFVQSR